MAVCDALLAKAIEVNCEEPIVPGLESNGIIINREDIDFGASKFADGSTNVLQSIALKTGAKAYKVVQAGNTPFTGTQTTMEVGTYHNTFTNDVSVVVLDNSPEVCEQIIDKLASGEFVMILENKHKGLTDTKAGDAAFQLYGWYQGLKASEITNEKYSEDTDGGWLTTLEETKAPKSGMFVYAGSYDATKELIDSLVA